MKQEILDTAALLNIDVSEEEAEVLSKSFEEIVKYFGVMQSQLNDIEDKQFRSEVVPTHTFRQDVAEQRTDTSMLIARSEEHEDNFVLIPHVL